jgi:hypothetical protein
MPVLVVWAEALRSLEFAADACGANPTAQASKAAVAVVRRLRAANPLGQSR